MAPPLSDEDLAYMRQTQDEHQPLALLWARREPTPDGAGGRTIVMRSLAVVTGRLDADPERVPDYLQDLATKGTLGVVSVPAGTDLRHGDVLAVVVGDVVDRDRSWEVVSHAWADQWTTARRAYVVPWRGDAPRVIPGG